MTELLRLDAERAALVVIDIQERLATAMPEAVLRANLRQMVSLMECAKLLGLPCVVTEQYSKGLGPTLPMVTEALSKFEPAPTFLEKVHFSCMAVDGFRKWIFASGRQQFILTGIETHVCVFQTARDLAAEGFIVHVPQDTTLSRTRPNFRIGLDLMRRAGAVITSAETVIFDLLKQAATDEFRVIGKLVK